MQQFYVHFITSYLKISFYLKNKLLHIFHLLNSSKFSFATTFFILIPEKPNLVTKSCTYFPASITFSTHELFKSSKSISQSQDVSLVKYFLLTASTIITTVHGLFSLVKEGNGRLVITSGRDSYEYVDGHGTIREGKHQHPTNQNFSTTVDFQLDYSRDISIEKVLTFQGKTFEFTNLYSENLENERGELVFKIAELAEGTGTRDSALRLKNEIINLISAKSQIAVLDFEGVSVATSSFIDELVAKLLVELGLFQFNQRIKLINMSNLLQQTLQKSVIQRIIEEYK